MKRHLVFALRVLILFGNIALLVLFALSLYRAPFLAESSDTDTGSRQVIFHQRIIHAPLFGEPESGGRLSLEWPVLLMEWAVLGGCVFLLRWWDRRLRLL